MILLTCRRQSAHREESLCKIQLSGKRHCSVQTITSNSCHRYFLFQLQAMKASIRKSASPNIEHSWNDFTKNATLFLHTHIQRMMDMNTVHNIELNFYTQNCHIMVYILGSTGFMTVKCLLIETLPFFGGHFGLWGFFQTTLRSAV